MADGLAVAHHLKPVTAWAQLRTGYDVLQAKM